jgi:excisionase family DNA binding protein
MKLNGKTRELTTAEVARELGVSVSTVYRRLKKGWFNAHKAGGRWVITTASYRLVEITRGSELAGYYEELSYRNGYDGPDLQRKAAECRNAGRSERYVYNAFYASREDAQAEAERRNARSLPGVTYSYELAA